MNACTIIAANYLAHARVLAESFFRAHPDGTFTVLSLDDLTELLEPRDQFRVYSVYDIGIEPDEVRRMALLYDVRELSTAVKPFLLRTLLEEQDHAVYLDPDIEVFRSMEFISDLAREHSLVLTPHSTTPMPRDGMTPAEPDIMIAGIYNLGFCAVGRGGRPFLDWWCERLARDCIADPQNGLFVDQKWVDWAPALFEHVILKDTTVNIAYWNFVNRHFEVDASGGYLVDGDPLTFFHFSGFDPRQPATLSKHQSRVDVARHPALARICREYAAAMLDAGYLEVRGIPCAFDSLPDGTRLDDAMRRVYRSALLTAEAAGRPGPPVPGDAAQTDQFLSWLDGPTRRRGPGRHISRYLNAVQEGRADLRSQFPDMGRRADVTRYLDWVRTHGASEMGIPERFAPPGSQHPSPLPVELPPTSDAPDVVTVAGYFRAELGVGEAGRSIVAGLEAAELPYATLTYAATVSRQEHPFQDFAANGHSDVNVVCVNADALPGFVVDAGPDFFRDRYTVGLWFWEVSEFPTQMHEAFSFVDEVWVASEFVRDAIQRETVKPVKVVPMTVKEPVPGDLDSAALGIPDGFTFLFVFDMMSIIERKNPFGLIEAFTRAFGAGDGAALVIKTINGDKKPEDLARLEAAAAQHPHVVHVDGYLPLEQKNGLMAGCDCYVSLHRSEGLGLTMAEAMALGKPVISTGYSGNLAFMDAGNSHLVDYELVPVGAGSAPYPETAEWAQPDLHHAARLMRMVFDDPAAAAAFGQHARADVLERMAPERTGAFVAERIQHIREHSMTDTRKPIAVRGPVARAESFVRIGPQNAWEQEGGRLGGVFRTFVRRLLKPYTVRQREFETAVVEALQDSLHAEVDLRAQLDDMQQMLRELLERSHSTATDRVEELLDEHAPA